MYSASLLILFLTVSAGSDAQRHAKVTWSREIAPILFQHCAVCHRAGQPAPFTLLTYDDVRKHADSIARVTQAHYMPPWKPVHGYGSFSGENRLSKAEIASIAEWVREGTPEGNPRSAPPAPAFPSQWQLGKPDAVVALPKSYSVPADGPDQYRCFVLPVALGGERYIRAFEFRPGATNVLHHALIFVDGRRRAPSLDPYECFGTPGFFPTGALGGWSPGGGAAIMPPGTATHIPKGARLVVQLHFHPTGKAETVDPSIALYYAVEPPTRYLMDVPLGSNHIDIPAGESRYQVHDHFELPVPVEVVGIIPHAHYICMDMKGWAILPDGHKRWLLWIDDWDFNWQAQYRYTQSFTLPAGTEIYMAFTYDNSSANIRNMNHPPQRIVWGPGSSDEMAGLHLQVIPKNDDDMHELGQALWGKVMRGVGGSFYRNNRP